MSVDSTATDGELAAALVAGDTSALDELDRRYRPRLLRLAVSRLGAERGEDAVQETFLCVLKSIGSYDSRYSFRTWLWTILLNQIRRQLQRQLKRPLWFWGGAKPESAAAEHFEPATSQAGPPEVLLARERDEQLIALLARLPEHQADALRLRFFGELKFQEIADSLGCSVSAAKHRVQQGLLQLSTWLAAESASAAARADL